ncbi:MAG TPA: hypothetical protein VLF87_02920, partial [Patescibacteria group bacterium]|nr:hypothetical protein [Patescibacteria group bacterium]
LIVMSVVAAVLAGAYVASNRNLRINQAVQERGESLKVAQGQLEALKAGPTPDPATQTTYFCIDKNNPKATVSENGPFSINNFSTYPSACQISPQGGTDYYVAIEPNYNGVSGTYAITSRWDSPAFPDQNEVKLVYRP